MVPPNRGRRVVGAVIPLAFIYDLLQYYFLEKELPFDPKKLVKTAYKLLGKVGERRRGKWVGFQVLW